jgi:hypothetical protein
MPIPKVPAQTLTNHGLRHVASYTITESSKAAGPTTNTAVDSSLRPKSAMASSRPQYRRSNANSSRSHGSPLSIFSLIFKALRHPSSLRSRSSGKPANSVVPLSPSPGSPLNSSPVSPRLSRLRGAKGRLAQTAKPALECAPQDSLEPVLERKLRDCDACGEEFLITDFPIRRTGRCNHELKMCHSCIMQWIESSLESNSLTSIKCPESSCKELLTHDDVRTFASREVFDRYSTFNHPDDCQVLPPQC